MYIWHFYLTLYFICSTKASDIKSLCTPVFPLDTVRTTAMEALSEAVAVNQLHNRDPIGGTNEDLFV